MIALDRVARTVVQAPDFATVRADGLGLRIARVDRHVVRGRGPQKRIDVLEELTQKEKDRFAAKVRKVDLLADRTPERAVVLEAEAAEIVGAEDLNELDADAVETVVDLHR